MKIQEKALKLAEYDGYNKKCHISESIEELQKECIKEYSSFDKLMELFSEINSYSFEDLWFINIDAFYVLLKNVNKGLVKQFEYNRNNKTLKEALIDCLLKYFELIESK